MADSAHGKKKVRKKANKPSRKPRPAKSVATAGAYTHGTPSAAHILEALRSRGIPMLCDELAAAFKLPDDRARKSFDKQLNKLVASGRLLKNRRNEYCLLAKIDALTGKVSGHPDGFGFLIPDDGSEDIFLPFHEMRALLDGDRVAVRLAGIGRKDRRKGAVVEILERGKTTVVGTFHREHGIAYVVEAAARSPHHFMVAESDCEGATHGQMVKLEIVEYPSDRREAQGRVIDVLGAPDDPGMLTKLAIEVSACGLTGPGRSIRQLTHWAPVLVVLTNRIVLISGIHRWSRLMVPMRAISMTPCTRSQRGQVGG